MVNTNATVDFSKYLVTKALPLAILFEQTGDSSVNSTPHQGVRYQPAWSPCHVTTIPSRVPQDRRRRKRRFFDFHNRRNQSQRPSPGANEAIRVAVAGINGRGGSHISEFGGGKESRITYLIDPDSRLFESRTKQVKNKGGNTPTCVQDFRLALDDKNVDVLSIAAPNHWHAPLTIFAVQAGKDVYVEKPASHNISEGRIAVELARKHNRIVQHGTQGRSGNTGSYAAELAKSGKVGKLLVSRGLCYKRRDNGQGVVTSVNSTAAPAGLDFNLWLGPAAERPFHENLVHYRWHWFWDFGNGDIGNQGVHEIDKARWGIPGATLPKSVISIGGRFGDKDQGETANTQVAIFDYGDTQLIFEVRGLKTERFLGQGTGNIYHYEEVRLPAENSSLRVRINRSISTSSPRSSAAPAAVTLGISWQQFAAERSRTSTPTSSKGTTRRLCAIWRTFRIDSATTSPTIRR